MAEETAAAAQSSEISPVAAEDKIPKEEAAADHKRKIDDDRDPIENAGEIEESKRQKVDGDADGSAVDGVEAFQSTEAPDMGNGNLPLTGDNHTEHAEVPEISEVASVGQDGATSRKILVPNNKVGVLIGKSGETIRNLQRNSGAEIQITKDAQADRNSSTRPVELIGTLEQVDKAEKLIKEVIAEADAGGSPALIAQGYGATQTGSEVFEMKVPNEKVGMIIGKGGETIKTLQTTTGARIQIIPQHLPEGDVSKERTVRVTGNKRQIEVAKEKIKDAMNKIQLYFHKGTLVSRCGNCSFYSSLSSTEEKYQRCQA